VVPVDELGASVREAQVVAADVEVDDAVAIERGAFRRVDQRRKVREEPTGGAEPEREKRLRAGADDGPAVAQILLDRRVGQAVGHRLGVQVGEGVVDRLDLLGRPRRRPVGVAEVLEDQDAVLGADDGGHERACDGRVDRLLGAQPVSREVVAGLLDEDGDDLGPGDALDRGLVHAA
jgi:hypothetical protein